MAVLPVIDLPDICWARSNLKTPREISSTLDRFRWLQLRARHGLGGSLLRAVRNNLVDVLFGLRARFCLSSVVEADNADFLLLQSSPRVIGLQRKRLLKEAIRENGYRLEEVAFDEPTSLLRKRAFAPPPYKVPLRYYMYAAHAEWLVRRYSPKVLLNDRNGSLYSPFLRVALRRHNGLLVHLAHATTLEGSRRLDMNDYDYYFLFGRSSFDALMSRPLRFGTSIAALTGSHMIDHSFDLTSPNRMARVVLVLGVGPDKEREAGYLRTYCMLRDWAREHPEYRIIVKRHPRSSVPFWREEASVLTNVAVLPADISLSQALSQASVVVNIMSNAVIESALAGRPIIHSNLSNDSDIFSHADFFGPSVKSADDFQVRMISVEGDFDWYIERSRAFSNFHLAHGFSGLEVTVQALKDLVEHSVLVCNVEQKVLSGTY